MGRGSPIEHPRDIEALFSVDVKRLRAAGPGVRPSPASVGLTRSLVHWFTASLSAIMMPRCVASDWALRRLATGSLSLPARGRHAAGCHARVLARAAGRRGRLAGKFRLLVLVASAAGLGRPGWPSVGACPGGIVATALRPGPPGRHRDRLGGVASFRRTFRTGSLSGLGSLKRTAEAEAASHWQPPGRVPLGRAAAGTVQHPLALRAIHICPQLGYCQSHALPHNLKLKQVTGQCSQSRHLPAPRR